MEVKVSDDNEQGNPSAYAGNKIGHTGLINQVFFLINKEPRNEKPIRNMDQNIF